MQERLELLGCPGLLLDLGDGAQFGGVGDERDVARHDPPFDGVVEGTADDEMDLQHRLRSERPGPVGGVELVVVEGFEMMRAEPPDRDLAEGGEDVPVDLAPVPVPGRVRRASFLPGNHRVVR
ncbi:hypothetical protein BMS3Bbin01_02042 [bacterium BMS3Bbin01]|nr:hypothetical protein BMS3Bbin01_02042 [bacterium BMS3Bbin01]